MATSSADAAGMPLAWGHQCLICTTLLHLGTLTHSWGEIQEGLNSHPASLSFLHATAGGLLLRSMIFLRGGLSLLLPPLVHGGFQGFFFLSLLLFGEVESVSHLPQGLLPFHLLHLIWPAQEVHDMFGTLDVPPGTKICMDGVPPQGVGSNCIHPCWTFIWAGSCICHHCLPTLDVPTIIFPASSHSVI